MRVSATSECVKGEGAALARHWQMQAAAALFATCILEGAFLSRYLSFSISRLKKSPTTTIVVGRSALHLSHTCLSDFCWRRRVFP